jgi:hypothetical protein
MSRTGGWNNLFSLPDLPAGEQAHLRQLAYPPSCYRNHHQKAREVVERTQHDRRRAISGSRQGEPIRRGRTEERGRGIQEKKTL